MGMIQRGADLFYTFRFIKLLVTAWTDTDAYKLGIVDADGKRLKDPETPEEKSAYTLFHRLVYNIKRLLNKVPVVGKTKLASWAAALWLIKEETGMSEQALIKVFEKYAADNDIELDKSLLESNGWMTTDTGDLRCGSYTLLSDIASPKTGDIIAKAGTSVIVKENTTPCGNILGADIFEVEHIRTRQKIFVSIQDIVQ